MSKFKIGDKVKVVTIIFTDSMGQNDGSYDMYIGKKYTISNIADRAYPYSLDNTPYAWHEDELQLIQQKILIGGKLLE